MGNARDNVWYMYENIVYFAKREQDVTLMARIKLLKPAMMIVTVAIMHLGGSSLLLTMLMKPANNSTKSMNEGIKEQWFPGHGSFTLLDACMHIYWKAIQLAYVFVCLYMQVMLSVGKGQSFCSMFCLNSRGRHWICRVDRFPMQVSLCNCRLCWWRVTLT